MSEICSFNVYPNITITKKIVKTTIRVCEYVPFTKAVLSVLLLDENDIGLENKIFVMDVTNGFLEWGSDDKYLVNWVKEKLSNS